MTTSYYKYCIVPECINSTLKTPKKLFIYVPNNREVRAQWLTLAGRADADNLSTVSRMYFCEDHFDLPNDMINYMEYYIMGKVSQVRLKLGCTPTKFECQEHWRKRKCRTERPYVLKKQRSKTAECLNESKHSNAPHASVKNTSDKNVQTDEEKVEEIFCEQTADITISTVIVPITEDKAAQTESKSRHQTSIMKTIKKIEKKPLLYIGVPLSCYDLIDLIKNQLNIPKHHVLLCLNKIRLNGKFNQLTDDYGMTPSCIRKIFFEKIPLIASVLRPFTVSLDTEIIQRTIPVSFRQNFYDVCCIIHCFEIEIRTPLKAVNQACTWSESKKAHTIKYLISCTPNGLVNYISPGFGGRTTDTCLVESCDFPKTLKSGMCIMADRGFENLEQYLMKSDITLVRLRSDTTGVKSQSDVIISKQIANLRTYVEIVDRRLREFCMLKQHACINFKFAKIFDDIVIIACAFINLQCKLP